MVITHDLLLFSRCLSAPSLTAPEADLLGWFGVKATDILGAINLDILRTADRGFQSQAYFAASAQPKQIRPSRREENRFFASTLADNFGSSADAGTLRPLRDKRARMKAIGALVNERTDWSPRAVCPAIYFTFDRTDTNRLA